MNTAGFAVTSVARFHHLFLQEALLPLVLSFTLSTKGLKSLSDYVFLNLLKPYENCLRNIQYSYFCTFIRKWSQGFSVASVEKVSSFHVRAFLAGHFCKLKAQPSSVIVESRGPIRCRGQDQTVKAEVSGGRSREPRDMPHGGHLLTIQPTRLLLCLLWMPEGPNW